MARRPGRSVLPAKKRVVSEPPHLPPMEALMEAPLHFSNRGLARETTVSPLERVPEEHPARACTTSKYYSSRLFFCRPGVEA